MHVSNLMRNRDSRGIISVVVGKHFTFLLIVVLWEIPTWLQKIHFCSPFNVNQVIGFARPEVQTLVRQPTEGAHSPTRESHALRVEPCSGQDPRIGPWSQRGPRASAVWNAFGGFTHLGACVLQGSLKNTSCPFETWLFPPK